VKPYFLVGAGANTENYFDLNAGGGGKIKLKLFKNTFYIGASLVLEVDGGAKVLYIPDDNKAKLKGYVQGGLVLTVPFDVF
jgi:hypothetical protein